MYLNVWVITVLIESPFEAGYCNVTASKTHTISYNTQTGRRASYTTTSIPDSTSASYSIGKCVVYVAKHGDIYKLTELCIF